MQKRKPTAVKQASALLIALTTAFLLVACGGEVQRLQMLC